MYLQDGPRRSRCYDKLRGDKLRYDKLRYDKLRGDKLRGDDLERAIQTPILPCL